MKHFSLLMTSFLLCLFIAQAHTSSNDQPSDEPSPQCNVTGGFTLKNQGSRTLYVYMWRRPAQQSGGDFCQLRQYVTSLAPNGGYVSISIGKDEAVTYSVYTSQNCSRNDLTSEGTLVYCNANSQQINVGVSY